MSSLWTDDDHSAHPWVAARPVRRAADRRAAADGRRRRRARTLPRCGRGPLAALAGACTAAAARRRPVRRCCDELRRARLPAPGAPARRPPCGCTSAPSAPAAAAATRLRRRAAAAHPSHRAGRGWRRHAADRGLRPRRAAARRRARAAAGDRRRARSSRRRSSSSPTARARCSPPTCGPRAWLPRAARPPTFVDDLPPACAPARSPSTRRRRCCQSPTRDHAAVSEALRAVKAAGTTATGEALTAALRLIETQRAADGRRSPAAIVLLSDGKSVRGADPVDGRRAGTRGRRRRLHRRARHRRAPATRRPIRRRSPRSPSARVGARSRPRTRARSRRSTTASARRSRPNAARRR